MKRISILNKDTILLGTSLLREITQETLSIPASTYILITDANLSALPHYPALKTSLETHMHASSRLVTLVIPAGEQCKTRSTKAMVEDWMFANGCTRDSVVIAFGGGGMLKVT